MKKANLLCTALALFTSVALPVQAQEQTEAEAAEKINEIKLDGGYIWAEGTSATSKQEALENAQAVLQYEIQNWLSEPGQSDIAKVVAPTADKYLKIETQRRTIHRAFIYVDKQQLMSINGDDKLMVVERREEPVQQDVEPVESVPAEEPVAEAAVEEVYTPSALENEMLRVKKFAEIDTFIRRHGITQTGKYKDRPTTGTYYIFIYNRSSEVPACLKVSDEKIINVATGAVDGFVNYKGCGGQWFIP